MYFLMLNYPNFQEEIRNKRMKDDNWLLVYYCQEAHVFTDISHSISLKWKWKDAFPLKFVIHPCSRFKMLFREINSDSTTTCVITSVNNPYISSWRQDTSFWRAQKSCSWYLKRFIYYNWCQLWSLLPVDNSESHRVVQLITLIDL